MKKIGIVLIIFNLKLNSSKESTFGISESMTLFDPNIRIDDNNDANDIM